MINEPSKRAINTGTAKRRIAAERVKRAEVVRRAAALCPNGAERLIYADRLKLTRFRGHRTVWVQGVHDGQDKIALRT